LIGVSAKRNIFCAGLDRKIEIARDLPVGQSLKARIITSDLANLFDQHLFDNICARA